MDNLPEKLDEFGRDENMELREDISQRASKRAARYAQLPAQQLQVCHYFWTAWPPLGLSDHIDLSVLRANSEVQGCRGVMQPCNVNHCMCSYQAYRNTRG